MEKEQTNASGHLKLQLSVTNSEMLETGKTGEHCFTAEGGTLGCSSNNEWVLQDLHRNVANVHARIAYQDGAFTLQLMGEILVINNAEITDRQQTVRLQHGDEIQVGFLLLLVRIGSTPETFIDPLNDEPEQIISRQRSPLAEMMSEGEDVTSMLPSQRTSMEVVDPIRAINANSLASSAIRNDSAALAELLPVQQISTTSPREEQDGAPQLYVDLPQPDASVAKTTRKSSQDKSLADVHLSLAPLLRGMGIKLPLLATTDEAYAILEELGQTIKAAINGLLALQHSEEIINNKNLRVIEDNPLRLRMGYEDTMSLLFDVEEQGCAVHLSAPAAVSESLNHVGLHNAATKSAINFALNAMLDAFSPEELLNRFADYRRSRGRNEMDGDWAWRMYCSFFKELSSNRQRGFEKLFWEHFEQNYDRTLRDLNQREKP